MTDDALVRAWRAGTEAARPGNASSQATEPSALDGALHDSAASGADEVWAAVRGELPPERAQAIVDAALVDDDALVELRLAFAIFDAAALHEATAHTPAIATVHHIEPRAANLRPWTVAAALAAAVALVWVLRPVPRSEDRGEVRDPASAMIASDDTAILDRNACELRWRARLLEGTFDLRVMTEDAVVIVQARGLGASHYVVPASALAAVPEGATLLWQVDHVLTDGTRHRSPTFSNRLR